MGTLTKCPECLHGYFKEQGHKCRTDLVESSRNRIFCYKGTCGSLNHLAKVFNAYQSQLWIALNRRHLTLSEAIERYRRL